MNARAQIFAGGFAAWLLMACGNTVTGTGGDPGTDAGKATQAVGDGVVCGGVCPTACCLDTPPTCTTDVSTCRNDRGAGGWLSCDGPEDCPGKQVCCLAIATRSANASCAATCENDVVVCHAKTECGVKSCTVRDPSGREFPSTLKTCQ